jgi:chaperonin GroES
MNLENFKPLNDRILLEVNSEVETMKNGLHIPDVSQEKSNIGTVIETHEGSPLKKGTRVMFQKYSGSVIMVDKRELRVISEKDLLGFFDQPIQGILPSN